MRLLTQEVLKKLPPLYSSENQQPSEILAVVKFFAPWSRWTWYAAEGSYVDADGCFGTSRPKVDFLCCGWVVGNFPELGYFSLSELEAVRGPFGLKIERDRDFTLQTLQALMAKHKWPL